VLLVGGLAWLASARPWRRDEERELVGDEG